VKWQYISSRSRGETGGQRSTEAKAGWLSIVVTRYHGLDPDRWFLRCHDIGIDLLQLAPRDLAGAQAEALEIVRQRLDQAMNALRK
jgi:hypothetical protein